MCGIIGIVGLREVSPLLLEGLKRLEYRGYDSAGIATLVNGGIDRRRAEGKIVKLEALVAERPLAGTTGIGHTRWATHGAPNERNAHPHATERVAVVHNGIIENFQELRDELVARGCNFATETDTEVVAHLLTAYLQDGLAPREAMQKAMPRLHGAFALAIMFAGHHGLLMGARRGCPLAVGYGEGEMYLGSDAMALALLTDRISYLAEGDWVELTLEDARIHDAQGKRVKREIKRTKLSGVLMGKGNFRHFMLKEIHDQPEALGDTLRSMINPTTRRVALPELPVDWAKVSRLTISACGTAFYAGLVGKYWLEGLARLPVEADIASEFRYREAPLPEGGVALFISQSGETLDTMAALDYARAEGQTILSVVNVEESSIARASDGVLPTHAGPEIGVASTKAFTTQLAVMACLAIAAARARGRIDEATEARLVHALMELPAHAAELLNHDARIAAPRQSPRGDPRRALSRARHGLSHRARRGAEAQGDFLHPCRGLRGGRDEAWADRPHRRRRAGNRHRALGPALREDGEQHAGGGGARWARDPAVRPQGHRQARRQGGGDDRASGGRSLRGAYPLRHSRCSSSPITRRCSRAPTSTSRATSPRASRWSSAAARWLVALRRLDATAGSATQPR